MERSAVTQGTPTRAELAELARAMVPILRERAPAAEERRRLHDETQRAFVESGFYRIFQPARYGGWEMDFGVLLDIGAEIGRGCGSAAWVFANLTGQSWINGMKSLAAQDEVWAKHPEALIAASYPAAGATAKKVDGGFVVDGTWNFSSGIDFADWNNLQLFIPREKGPPEHHFALVPRADYEIVDDWFPAGLAATGSRALTMKNVFIPGHRAISAGEVAGGPTPGSAVNPGPLYKLPLFAIGNKQFSAVALGLATGALEVMETDLATRRSAGGVKLGDQPSVQLRIAEASVEIEAARLLLLNDCVESMANRRRRYPAVAGTPGALAAQ
jgi:3-hydroxy-9,10-secoandrosta-1,3,5(10)-triene-9,17-dione monooxygenase